MLVDSCPSLWSFIEPHFLCTNKYRARNWNCWKYDKNCLFPMLLNCCQHSHPLSQVEFGLLKKMIEKIVVWTFLKWLPTREFVNKELFISECYEIDMKEIKCLFQCWTKHHKMFQTIWFLAKQNLGMVGS